MMYDTSYTRYLNVVAALRCRRICVASNTRCPAVVLTQSSIAALKQQ